jgi:glycosyltransferase involved in cell wall biosynthesis
VNVLLITFSFPPAGGVGVLRALSLARYLPENGVRVDVLTARNAPAVGRDLSLLQQVPTSVAVHRTWTLDLPFALRKRIKQILSRRSSAAPRISATSAGPGGLQRVVRRVRACIRDLVGDTLLPDPQIGWLPFALPAAKRIIRSRAIDVVLITVPPFSTLRLTAKLRRTFPELPIVIDFRDEWLTTTLSLVSFSQSARARSIAQTTEYEAVRAATTVVAVTTAAVEELRKRYPHQSCDKFRCIPNGFDISGGSPSSPVTGNLRVQRDANRPVVFTYIGSVYGSTDPRTFLRAVAELPPEHLAQLRIRFIGRVESDAYREALAALPGVVEVIGFLPQHQAIQELRRSDYALLITQDPINVSAKFYDYIGAGIPIVAAVHPEGEVRRLIEETNGGWWADIQDVTAIQRTLIAAIQRSCRGEAFRPNKEMIAQYHRRPLAARYAAVLSQVVRGASA